MKKQRKNLSMTLYFKHNSESENTELSFDISKEIDEPAKTKFSFGECVLYLVKLFAKLALRCMINFTR